MSPSVGVFQRFCRLDPATRKKEETVHRLEKHPERKKGQKRGVGEYHCIFDLKDITDKIETALSCDALQATGRDPPGLG